MGEAHHDTNYGARRPTIVMMLLLAQMSLQGASAFAEFKPEQVVIVANGNRPESLQVAEHYAARRGIPIQHVAKLNLPSEETMSREEYEREMVWPLRQFMQHRRIHPSIRVLVTVYGVPLRLAAPSLSSEEKRWRLDATDRLAAAKSILIDVERQAHELAGMLRSNRDSSRKSEQGIREFERNIKFLERVDRIAQDAATRLNALDASTRAARYARIEAWTQLYQGMAGLVQFRSEVLGPIDGADRAGLLKLRSLYATGMSVLLGSLELPVRKDREILYRRVEQMYGAYGVFALASLELNRLSTEYADASVDSELSLLWWDRNYYDADWRQANPLYHGYRKLSSDGIAEIPVLLVSRLDAPTPDLASRLVDRAMETEQKGPTGTMYLDARGLPVKDQSDAYGRYDQSLRDLQGFLTQHTTYKSVLENTETRFHRPGEAPDVALYVGWYRLRQYEDAFIFRPGAIGYHMASAEAVSVHRSSEPGWCKNALDRGITATIGSIGEPYLDAFPEPLEFVAMLATGQYSLVEAYYLTSRWVSWRMVLFGDPLYNPWKNAPAAPRAALSMFLLAPIAPSDQAFTDPLRARADRQRVYDESRIKLDAIFRRQESSARPAAPQ
jgi:uncharacterized protein (TIGR03790 family)